MSRTISNNEQSLRDLFIMNAESHPKQHGSWAIFKFPLENTYLSMDTWNGSFRYNIGSGGYEFWPGFNGKTVINFGGNRSWGDPGQDQPSNVIEFYIHKMVKELERRDEEPEG